MKTVRNYLETLTFLSTMDNILFRYTIIIIGVSGEVSVVVISDPGHIKLQTIHLARDLDFKRFVIWVNRPFKMKETRLGLKASVPITSPT